MERDNETHVWSLTGKPFRVADPARLERHPVGWLQKQKGLRRAIPNWTCIPPKPLQHTSQEVRRCIELATERRNEKEAVS